MTFRPARAAMPLLAAGLLAACQQQPVSPEAVAPQPVRVQLVAFNDFHGNLEPPRMAVAAPVPGSSAVVPVPAGGAAYLAGAIQALRARNPYTVVVSAGDTVSASPLVSSLFLDEPTMLVMNQVGLEFNSVGNHEFDRGAAELLRLQNGGCERLTNREPCQVDRPYPGAKFRYLAANVRRPDGSTLLPATALKEFSIHAGPVRVGFIGLTLKGTPALVTPDGVAGLRFEDEAATTNALVPKLKAEGADAIVVLIHEGGVTTGTYNDKDCPGLSGDIVPILQRLDPAVDVVVSGHTHRAYICDRRPTDPQHPVLLTSAGSAGMLLTSIDLAIDPRTRRVVARSAENVIVQGEGYAGANGRLVVTTPDYPAFPKDAQVEALVRRYAAAAAPLAHRVVGRLGESALRQWDAAGQSPLGLLIADSQFAASRTPERGGAQFALMNPGGVRADLVVAPGGGPVTYGQLFTVQPFGNSVVVMTMTGAQVKALLEQSGFEAKPNPRVLQPSAGFVYRYDASLPPGSRIVDMRLDGAPVDPNRTYRVAMNSFLRPAATGSPNSAGGANRWGACSMSRRWKAISLPTLA